MTVTVTRNFGPLTDQPLLTVQDWGRIGRLARERILARTKAGKDQHDAPFRPYSPGYAVRKSQMGGSPRVDLMVSGEMLRAITVEPDATGVTLAFSA